MIISLIIAFAAGFVSACLTMLFALCRYRPKEDGKLQQISFWKSQFIANVAEAHRASTMGDTQACDKAIKRAELAEKRFWEEYNKNP